ncbi:zinc-ribbon domain-containing protein [Ornithinibacillus halophilus]|uniref:Zinc-ribbon domain-containing protein n=2 Tax=Ornithinibacillus halophilus TaxID=930117 RepID=A0A1M5P2E7_9BACI|nr:zinc-ribbon domain-containing protein [Ornithinibacillus halophilus]
MQMNFCKECGSKLQDGARFCRECGTEVAKTSTSITNSSKTNTSTTNTRTTAQQSRVSSPKKKSLKWPMVAGVALIIIVAGIIIYKMNDTETASNPADEENNNEVTTETQTETNENPEVVEEEPQSVTSEQFQELFPDWQMIKQEKVNFEESNYPILVMGKKGSSDFGKVKLTVMDYNNQEKQWESVWETEEFEADPYLDVDSFLGDMFLLNPEGQNGALIVFNLLHSGNSGMYSTTAIQIDNQGIGTNKWTGYGTSMEVDNSTVIVYEKGETHITLQDGNVAVEEITRSDLEVTSDSTIVKFILDNHGLIVPTGDKEIYVELGEEISFVPADDITKQLFDDGEIAIYTNLWNNDSPVNTSNANRLPGGNTVEFTEETTVEFILEYYDGANFGLDGPPVTFIVHVGDGKAVDENTSAAITTRFQVGDSLTDLIDHYGEPSFDDYYNGGRLVFFEDDGYFIDGNELVYGFYITSSDYTIFNGQVGMTGNELNEALPVTTEPYFDDVYSQEYVYQYNIDDYKIHFYAKEENGPTYSATIIKMNY